MTVPVCNMCVYFVPCPPLLLVSIIHSFADDLTPLGLVSNRRQNLYPNLFLSSACYLSIFVPLPVTLSRLYCIFLYPPLRISVIGYL